MPANTLYFESALGINGLIWLSALRAGEGGSTRRVIEDVEPLFTRNELIFRHHEVTSAADFASSMAELAMHARNGLRPIIHIDMHGSQEVGLEIPGDQSSVSWERFTRWLRPINIETRNNLCVVSGACFGMHAIKPFKISEPVPVFALIAPEHEINVGFLEDHTRSFYADLLDTGDLRLAFKINFAPTMMTFNAEKFLAVSLMRYILNHCRGRGLRARREQLMTEIFLGGRPNTKGNRGEIRKLLKKGLKPNQATLDRYTSIFMIGKPCAFTMDDLLQMVDRSLQ